MSDLTTEHEEFAAKIRRMNAETEKFVAEQRKLIAEQLKLAAEQQKMLAEHDKLAAEALKLNRDRQIAPWQVTVVMISALGAFAAATIAALKTAGLI